MKTKKEIKAEYKLRVFPIGVFQIRNISNNKVFLDYSIDLESIWNRHRFQLNFGIHTNKNLQEEWKEFGEENFVYEIIDTIKQDEHNSKNKNYENEAKQLLAIIIEDLQPFDEKGYMIK